MSESTIFLIVIVLVTAVTLFVSILGNKIVDTGSNAIRNKAVRMKNAKKPNEPEQLADRFEKDDKK
jgi:hypothetical protein